MTIKELEEKTGLEVMMRSCWECNSAHERLKNVDYVIGCVECGRIYYHGVEVKIEKKNLESRLF
jgi:hypothetical protein